VDVVTSGEDNWTRFGHIISDVKTMLNCFASWDINYVGHNANCAAQNIAKLAAQRGINRVVGRNS
jgi:hypothetical protein